MNDLVHIIGRYIDSQQHISFKSFEYSRMLFRGIDYKQILCIQIRGKINTIIELSMISDDKCDAIINAIKNNTEYCSDNIDIIRDMKNEDYYTLHYRPNTITINNYGGCEDDFGLYLDKIRDNDQDYTQMIININNNERQQFLETLKNISSRMKD